MEKRVILAIGLSALLFLLVQVIQQKYFPQAPVTQPAAQTPVQEAKPAPAPGAVTPAISPAAKPGTVSVNDTKASARKIVVAGKKYRAEIDNRGAVLTSWKLNQYRSTQQTDKDWFQYIKEIFVSSAKPNQEEFEIIAKSRSDREKYFPASLLFPDAGLTKLANEEFYQVSIEGGSENGGVLAAPATVVLKLKRGDVSIEKRFRFEKDHYLVDFSMTCERAGRALDGQFFLGEDLGPDSEFMTSSSPLEAVYYAGGKVQRETPPKTEDPKLLTGDVRWVGLNIHYFAMIVIPDRPLTSFNIQKQRTKETERDLLRVTTPVNGPLQYTLYLGPKKQSDLREAKAVDLTDVINYGWIPILVPPFLISLQWIHQFVPNYGLSIIILTFFLSLLLFPFRLKQMVSMKKMQAVQPKIKAIQEKYKKNKTTEKRAEMNQEVMALYKEHGVNPLGGCVPLLLQFPLLIAFYQLLANSMELRHAPFLFWLQDLSIKDPTYLLPVFMGITMYFSQKMTPMAPGTDPTQAKMMKIMPVIFTYMFHTLSSGLNLYFLCSNIFQIAFQKIAERWMSGGKSGNKSKS